MKPPPPMSVDGEPHVAVVQPMRSEEGETSGVLASDVAPEAGDAGERVPAPSP